MKRSGPLKRTAFRRRPVQTPPATASARSLHPSNGLRSVSPKRRSQAAARRACVAAVIERDKVCQFPGAFAARAHLLTRDQFEHAAADIFCIGELTAHEPGHRRNVDPTDPDSCIALCWLHNQLVEDMPLVGYALGLLERANGLPLRGPFGGGHVAIVDRPELYDQETAS